MTTVTSQFSHWLEKVVRPNHKPKTYHTYATTFRRYIEGPLGSRPLSSVSRKDIESLLASLAQKSSSTRRLVFVVLSGGFAGTGFAPMAGVTVARARRKRLKAGEDFWTPEQAMRFLDVVRQERPRDYALFYLAFDTGLRFGELLGLHWEDIDFAEKTLTVRATLVEIGGRILGRETPKTDSAQRTLSLPDEAIEALKAHKASAGGAKAVFVNRNGGYFFQANVTRTMDALAVKAGLPLVKFHALRHANASWMMADGADLSTAAGRLGHSDGGVLLLKTYAHFMPRKDRLVAARLGGMLRAVAS